MIRKRQKERVHEESGGFDHGKIFVFPLPNHSISVIIDIIFIIFLLGAGKGIKCYVEQMNMVHILIRKVKNRSENKRMSNVAIPSNIPIHLPTNIYPYLELTFISFRHNRNENSKKSIWVTRNMGLYHDLYELYRFDHFWMVSWFVTILWDRENIRDIAHIQCLWIIVINNF